MTVKSITKNQYYQLVGLKTLAESHDRKMGEIHKSVLEILQETKDDYLPYESDVRVSVPVTDIGDGWSGELVYTDKSLDDVLRILKIEVEE